MILVAVQHDTPGQAVAKGLRRARVVQLHAARRVGQVGGQGTFCVAIAVHDNTAAVQGDGVDPETGAVKPFDVEQGGPVVADALVIVQRQIDAVDVCLWAADWQQHRFARSIGNLARQGDRFGPTG